LGIRTTILEVAFIGVVNKAVRDADGRSTISQAIAEFIYRLGLVETSETKMIVWTVNSHVFVFVLIESRHQFLEVIFAANLTEVLCGEVRVHSRAIPIEVFSEWFAMEVYIYTKLFTEANEKVTSDPDFIGGTLGAFSENLEFPLTFGHFGIDAFVVDAGVEAEIKVLLDDFTSDVADGAEADTSVVRALWSWEAIFRETERATILIEEIFLLEAEPSVGIIQDRGTGVGNVRSAIRQHDLAHDENAIFTGRVRENGYWLENAI
jgi:hypothetical protein